MREPPGAAPAGRPPLDDATLCGIEDAGLNASAPREQWWLDGWLVRLSPGKAKRARCVNALAPGRLPLADKLQQVRALYRQAALPFVVRVTPFTVPVDLEDGLRARGMRPFDPTQVMALFLDEPVSAPPGGAALRLEPVDAGTFADFVGACRQSPPEQRRAHALRMAASPVPYRGWLLRQGQDIVACGQYAREGDRVGLYDILTLPAWRGRGFASVLCRWLLEQARAEGAALAYLQVDVDNAPARAVYRRLGFVDAYRYHYLADDPAAA